MRSAVQHLAAGAVFAAVAAELVFELVEADALARLLIGFPAVPEGPVPAGLFFAAFLGVLALELVV